MSLKNIQEQNEKVEKIIDQFLLLKKNSVKSLANKQEFEKFQNFCMKELNFLVQKRVAKYKKFSNYQDLQQDGYEALLYALRTFKREKGCFSWWADKYISTRVSRAANTHSTIRFPLKVTKESKPHKISIDTSSTDEQSQIIFSQETYPSSAFLLEKAEENAIVGVLLNKIDQPYQDLLKLTYGLANEMALPVSKIIKQFQISRSQYLRLLEEAKTKFKNLLDNYEYSDK